MSCVQVSTDGTLNVRAPQLTSPVTLTWTHSNSLHDVNCALTLTLKPGQRVHLEVGGTANIVSNV